ncbi:hypothetical protein D3C72_2332230 [compost metagenome]
MVDRRCFAVHQTFRADDVAAKGLPDRLMSQAYAEDRYDAFEMLQQLQADARFIRGAGSR